MPSVSDWVLVLLAFAVSGGLCWRFLSPASRFHVLDHPGERSLHQQATPRSGGVAIVTAILLAWTVAAAIGELSWSGELAWLFAAVVLLAVTGGVDDRQDLSPLIRLLVQLLAALALLAADLLPRNLQLPGMDIFLPGGAAAVLMLLYVLWMTNLYNFMDGMDGFAGGMAVIGFAVMAWLGWRGGDEDFLLASLIVAAASAGFLLFNFPPARLFMGDAGAPVLGFLAAAFSLWADREGLFPLWVAVLIFSPFVADASYTLLRRLLAGRKVWQAHREHVYQRLVQMGWSHRRTVLWSYALMLAAGGAAVMALNQNTFVQWATMASWAAAYATVILLVGLRERRN
ncbi:MraY family glycosyltransferase [Thiolapillus sp.]